MFSNISHISGSLIYGHGLWVQGTKANICLLYVVTVTVRLVTAPVIYTFWVHPSSRQFSCIIDCLTSNMLAALLSPPVTLGLLAPLLAWLLVTLELWLTELARLSRYTEVGNTRLPFRLSIVSMWLFPVNQVPSLARLLSSWSWELVLDSVSELAAFSSRMCFLSRSMKHATLDTSSHHF